MRWTAPEGYDGKHCLASDVWSYGVLLWEIFTNGKMPYHTLKTSIEVVNKVCGAGWRLPHARLLRLPRSHAFSSPCAGQRWPPSRAARAVSGERLRGDAGVLGREARRPAVLCRPRAADEGNLRGGVTRGEAA